MVLLVLVSPLSVFADLDETSNDVISNINTTISVVNTSIVDNTNISDDSTQMNNETEIEVEEIEEVETEVEENETEVETEDVINNTDAEILSDLNGARVRLAQLERRIEAQIDGANLIIDKLEANNKSVDYERLNEIVKSFELLLIQIDGTDFNSDTQTLANEFVVIKSDAIALSQEFRETVKDSLKEAEKEELRNRIETKKAEVYAKHQAKIDELKNKYNAKKTAQLAKAYGISAEDLEAKILSGELTLDQIKSEIKGKYDNLSDEEKQVVKQKIAEEMKKSAIEVRQKIEENKEVIKQRNEVRKEEIKSEIEARKEEIKQRTETRKETFDQRREEAKTNLELAKEEAKLNREIAKDRLRDSNLDENEVETEIETESENEDNLNSTQ